MENRRVTLADVARETGLSKGTVSKALNDKPDIAESTKLRVRDAAARMGFTPDPVARVLGGGRSGTVGILTSDLDGRFVLPILMGAEDALVTGEVSALLCDARGDTVRERRQLRTLLDKKVDGIIVVGHSNDPRRPIELEVDIPVVYAYAPAATEDRVSIVPDNYRIAQLATEHLVDAGRTKLIHISGFKDACATQDRSRAFEETLKSVGLQPAMPTLFGSWGAGWGRAAALRALSSGEVIDGIVCASDRLAMGAIHALQQSGVSVPADISVVGIDNVLPLVADLQPSLTSVDLGLEDIGRLAAMTIFEELDGGARQRGGVVHPPHRLHIRESSLPTAV